MSWDSSIFVTLTYSDEFVPKDGSLWKRELQWFWKRYRRAIEPRRVRYYLSGEYGDKFGRPHYHAIVFGGSLDDRDTIEQCWSLGFVKVSELTAGRIRYTASYVQKKLYGDACKERYGDRQPPFSLQSTKLGHSFAVQHSRSLRENLALKENGYTKRLPRYYRKVLGITAEEIGPQAQAAMAEEYEKLKKRFGVLGMAEASESIRKQREADYKARDELLKKGDL